MGIKHTFTSAITDSPDTTRVRPSNWNADHTIDGDVNFNGFSIVNSGNLTVTDFVNIVDDYGAVGDGVTDDSAAFSNFTSDYQGERVTLFMPPGEYRIAGTSNHTLFGGVSFLEVLGYGATLFDDAGVDGYFSNAHQPLILMYTNGNAVTALLQSADRGATTVTTVTPADASIFTVGDLAVITGNELQGYSWPINPYYFEYAEISAINAGTGLITLKDHKLGDSYKSTWPAYINDPGGGFNLTSGPAKIGRCDPLANCEWHFKGLRFTNANVNLLTRIVRYTDCHFVGAPNVSGVQKFDLTNCYIGDGDGIRGTPELEMDKYVEEFNIKGCVFAAGLLIQSPNKRLHIEDTDMGPSGLQGTCRFNTFINSRFSNLIIGPRNFGLTETISMDGCAVDAVLSNDAGRTSVIGSGPGDPPGVLKADWTYTNGTISMTKVSNRAVPWAIPGAIINGWDHSNQFWNAYQFKVIDVRETGGNVEIDVTRSAADWSSGFSGDRIVAHSCPDITVTNSTGDRQFMDMAKAPPHTPMFGYMERYYVTPDDFEDGNLNADMLIRGYISELQIDVIRAYSGTSGTLTMTPDSSVGPPFGFPQITINLKQTGLRIITQQGNQCIFSSDTVSSHTGEFLSKRLGQKDFDLSTSISAEAPATWPIVRVRAWMDQGFAKTPWVRSYAELYQPDPGFVIGSPSLVQIAGTSPRAQVNSTSGYPFAVLNFSSGSGGPQMAVAKSRNATVGSHTIVQSGDLLGGIDAYGSNGTTFSQAGYLAFFIDGTPGASNDMPGLFEVGTAPDGTASPVKRMTIKNDGGMILGTATVSPGAGNIQMGTATHAFSNLPGSPAVGMIAYVSDSNTATHGATVASGGANKILAWYNGTNWTVVGS